MKLRALLFASVATVLLAQGAQAAPASVTISGAAAGGGTVNMPAVQDTNGARALAHAVVDGSGNIVNPATSDLQAAAQAAAGSDATKALAVQGVTGGKPLATVPAYGPSGVTACTDAITSARATACVITPVAGRDFNASTWGTFVAAFQMERSFDAGTTWLPITAAGTQMYAWTGAESESAGESEYGVQYRIRVTSYTSGTINVRLSQ